MDFSTILQALNSASLFDLHRLNSAINVQLNNPKRNALLKSQLHIGQTVSWFDPQSNNLIDAVVLKIQISRCLVRNIGDQKSWNLPFYYINLQNIDVDITASKGAIGIPKISLKVGAMVGFKDRNNNELFGEVIRLNPKRATIRISSGKDWLVPYSQLFSVIDAEADEVQSQVQLDWL